VQTVKQVLKKADAEGNEPYLAVLNCRSSPITGLKYSPAELHFGRELRTKLPFRPRYLNQADRQQAAQQLQHLKLRQKQFYDRGSVSRNSLCPKEVVRVQKGQEWLPAVVKAVHKYPRSYVLQQGDQTIRRNSRHIGSSHGPGGLAITSPGQNDSDDLESLTPGSSCLW
jgi:hypothetical protein